MAFGAVAGSIAVLITCVQNDQLINIGVVRFPCCLINCMFPCVVIALTLSVECIMTCREVCCNVASFCWGLYFSGLSGHLMLLVMATDLNCPIYVVPCLHFPLPFCLSMALANWCVTAKSMILSRCGGFGPVQCWLHVLSCTKCIVNPCTNFCCMSLMAFEIHVYRLYIYSAVLDQAAIVCAARSCLKVLVC